MIEEGMMKFPKHTGGSWYELSNGDKIQGKDAAAAAEGDLQGGGEAPAGGLPDLAPDPAPSAHVELAQAASRIVWGLPTAEDGLFGLDTARKVREVQQRAGLEVTGVVDSATWTALLVGPADV